jgi:serine/threonine protein phosphatase PrpC
MKSIKSKTGGRTDNQDFYGSAQTQYGDLIIVCDGMGGHNGGRHAAEISVQTIIEEVTKSKTDNPVNVISEAITKADSAIWEESQSDKRLQGMGTTVVVLLITRKKAISFHVGDSRIYQLRNGKIQFRTFDHSHVFEMVKAGLLTEEQARLSEKSNIITRALGIMPNVDIDINENLTYKNGDRFLLCTDGIWGNIPENELVDMASQNENIERVLNQMVDKIDAIGFDKGGKHDNLTAALLEMESDSSIEQSVEIRDGKNQKYSNPLSKLLIYLLLIALTCSLALNVYLISIKEKDGKKNVQKINNMSSPKVDSKASDTVKTIKLPVNENN